MCKYSQTQFFSHSAIENGIKSKNVFFFRNKTFLSMNTKAVSTERVESALSTRFQRPHLFQGAAGA